MIVLSLFDGISVGQLALEMAGIKVDKYFASEIDKYANQVTMKHFPDTIQLGDVTKIDVSTLPKIDLLLGGSPCQGFSSAGKGLNFKDPRSVLFFEFVRIKNELTERNPDLLFLLENVKMISEWENVISEHVGIYPVEINSALVSAQQRKRLYWTNVRTRHFGMFGHLISDIPQPGDQHIYLKDIVENGRTGKRVAEKYYLSAAAKKRINRRSGGTFSNPQVNPEKTGTLNPKNNSGQLSLDNGTTLLLFDEKGELACQEKSGAPKISDVSGAPDFPLLLDTEGNLKENQEKINALMAAGNGSGNHSNMDILFEKNIYKDKPFTIARIGKGGQGQKILSVNGKCLALDISHDGKESHVQDAPIRVNDGPHCQGDRVYSLEGKASPITSGEKSGGAAKGTGNVIIDPEEPEPRMGEFSKDWKEPVRINLDNLTGDFRRLTPLECERAQTLPDNFTEGLSDRQRYKCTGNCWTAAAIAHIFSYMEDKWLK